jgi:hypothetical protein
MKAKRQIESSLNSVTMLDGTGGHVKYIRSRIRLANRTKLLRSTGLGTILVHQCLNPCRAMTLCCTAKSP